MNRYYNCITKRNIIRSQKLILKKRLNLSLNKWK